MKSFYYSYSMAEQLAYNLHLFSLISLTVYMENNIDFRNKYNFRLFLTSVWFTFFGSIWWNNFIFF